jgi:hypothetical protein
LISSLLQRYIGSNMPWHKQFSSNFNLHGQIEIESSRRKAGHLAYLLSCHLLAVWTRTELEARIMCLTHPFAFSCPPFAFHFGSAGAAFNPLSVGQGR